MFQRMTKVRDVCAQEIKNNEIQETWTLCCVQLVVPGLVGRWRCGSKAALLKFGEGVRWVLAPSPWLQKTLCRIGAFVCLNLYLLSGRALPLPRISTIAFPQLQAQGQEVGLSWAFGMGKERE